MEPFQHTNHKNLWNWLANNPSKEKDYWLEWEFNGGDIKDVPYGCFACDCCEDCTSCPLIWPINVFGNQWCQGLGGLFTRWYWENNLTKRSELARQIVNLPVKDGVPTV